MSMRRQILHPIEGIQHLLGQVNRWVFAEDVAEVAVAGEIDPLTFSPAPEIATRSRFLPAFAIAAAAADPQSKAEPGAIFNDMSTYLDQISVSGHKSTKISDIPPVVDILQGAKLEALADISVRQCVSAVNDPRGRLQEAFTPVSESGSVLLMPFLRTVFQMEVPKRWARVPLWGAVTGARMPVDIPRVGEIPDASKMIYSVAFPVGDNGGTVVNMPALTVVDAFTRETFIADPEKSNAYLQSNYPNEAFIVSPIS